MCSRRKLSLLENFTQFINIIPCGKYLRFRKLHPLENFMNKKRIRLEISV
jgi:hypothetical protein